MRRNKSICASNGSAKRRRMSTFPFQHDGLASMDVDPANRSEPCPVIVIESEDEIPERPGLEPASLSVSRGNTSYFDTADSCVLLFRGVSYSIPCDLDMYDKVYIVRNKIVVVPAAVWMTDAQHRDNCQCVQCEVDNTPGAIYVKR